MAKYLSQGGLADLGQANHRRRLRDGSRSVRLALMPGGRLLQDMNCIGGFAKDEFAVMVEQNDCLLIVRPDCGCWMTLQALYT